MSDGPALILLHGGGATGEAEGMVARTRLAAARVGARAAREGGFGNVVLATNDAGVAEDSSYSVDRDAPGQPFSLQKRVLGLVEELDAGAVAVMGAGALPFL
ncbi:MAG: hypothetical protein F4052_00130, partial [Dehalococcoidia bacterium]|nr:hypothetical protein [Dehalococcoidia bacterium]